MPSNRALHLHIYPLPDGPRSSISATELQTLRFEISFEQAVAQLELLPRMFIELDGAFVWSGLADAQTWQIDGMLYDHGGHVQRVELKGRASRQAWEQLLTIFGWPTQPMLAHQVDQQRYVELSEFLIGVE